jgi:hypothetical protein
MTNLVIGGKEVLEGQHPLLHPLLPRALPSRPLKLLNPALNGSYRLWLSLLHTHCSPVIGRFRNILSQFNLSHIQFEHFSLNTTAN